MTDRTTSAFDNLTIDDNDDILLDSPEPQRSSELSSKPQKPTPEPSSSSSSKPRPSTSDSTNQEARDAALQAELATLKRINGVVENVIGSLDRAKANMDTLSNTVTSTTTLLDTWTRILSQTEHNQRLLLNPAWQGATQDVADAENQMLNRAREKQRREAEDAARREAAEERRRADEEKRRADAEKRAAAASRTPGKSTGSRRGVTGRAGGYTGSAVNGTRSGSSLSTGTGANPNTDSRRQTQKASVSGYGRVGSAGTRGTSTRGRGRGIS